MAERELIRGLEEPDQETLQEPWKKIGFMRHAPEFWCLAVIILQHSELLRMRRGQRENGNYHTKKGFLEKYDETNMSQVHDLVGGMVGLNINTDTF